MDNKKQPTEKEIDVVLNKNIFIAYLSATLELATILEGEFNQKEKYVYNRAMAQLNKILSSFEHYSNLSPVHVARVNALMDYAGSMFDSQKEIILKELAKESDDKE